MCHVWSLFQSCSCLSSPNFKIKIVIPIYWMAFLGNTGAGKGFENGKNSLCYDCYPQFSVSCAVLPKYFKVLPSYLHMKKKPAALKGLFRKSNSRYVFCFHLVYTNPHSHLRGENSVMSMIMTVYDILDNMRTSSLLWQVGRRCVMGATDLPCTSCGCLHLSPAARLCAAAACTWRISKDCQPLEASWEIRPEAQDLLEGLFL